MSRSLSPRPATCAMLVLHRQIPDAKRRGTPIATCGKIPRHRGRGEAGRQGGQAIEGRGSVDSPDVTIIGAGMAGMTAALKLLEAGFTVRVLEGSSNIGGQFGAVLGKTGFHDFAWHVFADWCLNFWKLVDTIGLRRDVDFVSRPTTILLRPRVTTSTLPRAVRVATVGTPETFWNNAASGVAHWSDVMLYAYAQAKLLVDEALEREEFLNRVTLNGYVRSLPYASDRSEERRVGKEC